MAYGLHAGAHPRRALILATLRAQPGLSFRAVAGATGIAAGTTRHHLNILLRQDAIWEMPCGGSILHYPGPKPRDDRDRLAAHAASLQADLADVLAYVRANPGVRQGAVLEAFSSAPRSSVQHRLKRLVAYGLVANRPAGRSHHLYPA